MRHMLLNVLIVGAAGFAGAITRYLVGHYVGQHAVPWLGKTALPVGTLVINVTASFALGLFMAWASRQQAVDERLTLAVATGFIGTYSTFSTYMFETDRGLRAGDHLLAMVYLLASVALGLAAVRGGWLIGRGV